ncbi:hypothetical protein HC174_03555 [Salinimicrobium sp. CDJ15-81-2]|nr:hypothetical protein [Salinimicrobium nanhaiense]
MENLKNRDALINRIKKIEDKNVLDEINRLLDINFDDSVYNLNEDQETEIAQARKELNRGEGISSEQVEKEFDEWLNK